METTSSLKKSLHIDHKLYTPDSFMYTPHFSHRRNTLQQLPPLQFAQFTYKTPTKSNHNVYETPEKKPAFITCPEKKSIELADGYKTMNIGSAIKLACFGAKAYQKPMSNCNPTIISKSASKYLTPQAYEIKFLIPPKRYIAFGNEGSKRLITVDGFLKEHDFISQTSKEAFSIKSLSSIQKRLVTAWRNKDLPPKRLRNRVMKIIDKLRQLKLDPEEINKGIVFSVVPYQKEYSKELINVCKEGRYDLVSYYLNKNKYLVYDFDHTKKTALHWAAIRSNYAIMQLLINYKSDIDAQDFSFKTPLHYSSQNDDLHGVKLLLANEADPFIHCNLDLEAKDLSTSTDIMEIIKRVRKITIMMKWIPWKEQRTKLSNVLRGICDSNLSI